MKLYYTVNKIINDLDNEYPEDNYGYSFLEFIRNCRTIDLNLPRRSGKTFTITKLATEKSCLVLTRYSKLYPTTKTYSSDSAVELAFRGQRPNGLKYQCIMIDEDTSIDINRLVCTLKILGMLTKDFFILKLGTK